MKLTKRIKMTRGRAQPPCRWMPIGYYKNRPHLWAHRMRREIVKYDDKIHDDAMDAFNCMFDNAMLSNGPHK